MERFDYARALGATVLSATMREFTYKRHAHAEYALGVTLKGLQQYHLKGTLHTSHPSGVMLFNPEQAHDGNAGDRAGIEYVMLYIPAPLFAEVSGRRDAARFATPIVYDRTLAGSILRLARGVVAGRDEALCSELLLKVVRGAARSWSSESLCRSDAAVRRAVEFMRDGVDSRLRLDELCREIQMSKYHFIRQFSASMGISPYQYFLSCKAEQAKRLLESGEDVYTAALECGFYDLSHLNRHFKRMYGVTASKFASIKP